MSVTYDREPLNAADLDSMRINLSVQPAKLHPEPCCDFCGNTHPVYKYASKRMSTGQWRHCWRWLACEDCDQAIQAGEWNRIISKIVAWLQQKMPIAQPMAQLAAVTAMKDFDRYVIRK
jgi:hypothetical protein